MFTATFQHRLNRFVVDCLAEGEVFQAHLPNPGRLWELLLPGTQVLVRENPNSKYGYQVMAAYRKKVPIMLHTHRTNKVVKQLVEERQIPGLQEWDVVKTEPKLGEGRSDLLLQKGEQQLYLEIKTVTLFETPFAMFPDAVTKRGRRHLKELAAIDGNHQHGAVLFVVQYPGVEYFLPEFNIDPVFSKTLLAVRNQIDVHAVTIGWNDELELTDPPQPLEIPWSVLEQENYDRGSYWVILQLAEAKQIEIGKLGKIDFPAGYYIYVGNAAQRLQKRMARHRRTRKNCHWHIDYLRNAADWCHSLPVRSSTRLECSMARDLSMISDESIPHFGSSDCDCESHLFRMDDDPVKQPAFIDHLLEYRVRRLEGILGEGE